jgi:hypothetical protein
MGGRLYFVTRTRQRGFVPQYKDPHSPGELIFQKSKMKNQTRRAFLKAVTRVVTDPRNPFFPANRKPDHAHSITA